MKPKLGNSSKPRKFQSYSILETLPPLAKKWAESLPWEERRYVLSLCHLLCGSTPDLQAEFLDEYTADGLVARMLEDRDTQHQVQKYLFRFYLKTELNQAVLKSYVRQFFIHSSQDLREQPHDYLESALRLVISTEEKNSLFNYILGFELLKMIFQMSWAQQERLSILQKSPTSFIKNYIKPIQKAHKLNGIVVPKYERIFFEKHDYYVQIPDLSEKRSIELVMNTFTTNTVSDFGFSMIRHPQSLTFDYEYIYQPEQESIFTQDLEVINI
ncbi:cobyrinic acid a,c-diamide synthase [Aerosakkonema funiforme]|uniref:Cobyrinic acid a,c-diamide synthase n=1 Tax=Aerosakkonema funiforme FACHB-1375 TaxID=2949571 RepID=A0A926VHN0_9CYAN|nr:cobyrinic acid a,c-diamide synthase [Aerosakkonema funiforme]MBD2184166.1 cobyrinic acid a,c-diamide synthase [Aerosakkonema funiforme FACHB-1375]